MPGFRCVSVDLVGLTCQQPDGTPLTDTSPCVGNEACAAPYTCTAGLCTQAGNGAVGAGCHTGKCSSSLCDFSQAGGTCANVIPGLRANQIECTQHAQCASGFCDTSIPGLWMCGFPYNCDLFGGPCGGGRNCCPGFRCSATAGCLATSGRPCTEPLRRHHHRRRHGGHHRAGSRPGRS
jgi:hypothetical protein